MTSFDKSDKKLHDGLSLLETDTRNEIFNWQNNLGKDCRIPKSINDSKDENYGKKPKGFGDVCESIFMKIVKAIDNQDYDLLKQIAPTLIYFDDKCICFLPAGPRNKTLLTANPTSFNLGGLGGASSHLHLLVIPRIPIYNAITLTSKHIDLIKHMERVGKHIVCQLATADSYFKDSNGNILQPKLLELPDWNDRMNRILSTNIFSYQDYLPYGFDLCKSSARDILGCFAECVNAFFQIHPEHSIGYLHMHIIPYKLITRAGENYFENNKFVSANNVIRHLSHVK